MGNLSFGGYIEMISKFLIWVLIASEKSLLLKYSQELF